MSPCPHGLEPRTCGICGARSSPIVYVSAGGTAYHRTRECPNLLEGRKLVEHRGGELGRIVPFGRARLARLIDRVASAIDSRRPRMRP